MCKDLSFSLQPVRAELIHAPPPAEPAAAAATTSAKAQHTCTSSLISRDAVRQSLSETGTYIGFIRRWLFAVNRCPRKFLSASCRIYSSRRCSLEDTESAFRDGAQDLPVFVWGNHSNRLRPQLVTTDVFLFAGNYDL